MWTPKTPKSGVPTIFLNAADQIYTVCKDLSERARDLLVINPIGITYTSPPVLYLATYQCPTLAQKGG